jgi:hypothetical protein
LLLAGAVGTRSPLKAIFPMVSADDIYRDTSFMGGLLDFEFDETYLGLTAGLNTTNPITDTASDSELLSNLAGIEADHANGLASYHAAQTANILTGGDESYDGSYWQARNPQNILARVVANHIPAYLIGGEFDIFQNGEPLNYAELQNAWDGRSPTAPMVSGQRTTATSCGSRSPRRIPRTSCRCPASFRNWRAGSTRSRARRARRRRSPSRRSSSVFERTGVGGHVDRVLLEQIERHDIERPLVRGGEDDESGDALFVRAQPGVGRHAPAVPGLEAGKVVLGRRRAQVIPDAPLILEKFSGHDGADRVTPQVTGAGTAAAVAVEAGERVGAARLERAAEHIALHRESIVARIGRGERRPRSSGWWRGTECHCDTYSV